ncbi:ABC transporter ATP-binding protein [Fenollaria sporofastidiosus]|uniref:ABC transporter ATP-binding protein n=1 Tax=Fenollaria sporofastidiosus TaxID=2811778 RepID=UPI001C0015D9|nr:ABC transporter ATP-binding protein [Fenollaria sporofastidiosus]
MRITLFNLVKKFKKEAATVATLNMIYAVLLAFWPLLTKFIIDNYIYKNDVEGFPKFVILMLAFVVMISLTELTYCFAAGKFEKKVILYLRSETFLKTQKLSAKYMDTHQVGWLVSRLVHDTMSIKESVAWNLFDMADSASRLIIIFITMYLLNAKLSLYVLASMPFIAAFTYIFQGKMMKAQKDIKEASSDLTSKLNEDIQGQKTIKTLLREKENLEEFKAISARYKRRGKHSITMQSLYIPSLAFLGSIATAFILKDGGAAAIVGTLTVGTLFAMVQYSTEIYEPIRQLASVLTELISMQASMERVNSILEADVEVYDTKEIEEVYGDALEAPKKSLPQMKGEIEFKNVSFAYKDEDYILKDFSLKIKDGERLALVGETGGGKSTIINIASRFYEPTKGKVFIDGIDYTQMPLKWVQMNLGYVLQTPYLFRGSIRDNILYGRDGATEEDMLRAAEVVGLDEIVKSFKDGYDTDVGEGGGKLSQGEKQLVSFARALIKDPAILILDEATSSVDTYQEKRIQDAIEKLLEGRTSITVAHRLSTIVTSDRILYIHQGRIAEMGTHRELIAKKGLYYNLYRNQYIESQLENI